MQDFFAHLQSMKDELEISDIHVSLTTLEEVFINVAKQSELEAAVAESRVESLILSNGTTIHVSCIVVETYVILVESYFSMHLCLVV